MELAPLQDAKRCAIILAGAGTHGAFEAGALDVLLNSGHRFGTVVGASSGALNGTLLAFAIRAGKELELAKILPDTWLNHTGLTDVFSPSLGGIFGLRGISGEGKLLSTIEELSGRLLPGVPAPVRLILVVTALEGRMTEVGSRPATTFEYPVTFTDADFDTGESRDKIYRTAVASGAIPIVFVPVDLPGVGPCADGGLVNNTPIKHALLNSEVTRVFVVVPYPSPVEPPPPGRGLDYVAHVFDIFIQERLLRDLREAVDTNHHLAAIEALAPLLPADKMQGLRDALGLSRKRAVEIVLVRPPQTLQGNELSGFGNTQLRQAEIDAGRDAARNALQLAPMTT
jgi:predicted acylesterase/phospholipase RssA